MSDYQTMAQRIRSSTSSAMLDQCDKSLDRLWNNGIFTTNEFQRLDSLVIDMRIKLEAIQ